jgi:RecA-family ATPase
MTPIVEARPAHTPRSNRSRVDRLNGRRPIRAAEVEPRPVDWLWRGKVPLAGLTVLAGEPGLGKSLLSILLAARLSRGHLDVREGPTLFLTAEDSREHTVVPRLMAAGADLDRVLFPPSGADGFEQLVHLPDDVEYLSDLVGETGTKLVVIDPLVAHLPPKVNSWQDQSVRGALAPLAALAHQHDAAVLLIGHLNKAEGNDPFRRLGGSIGIAAAARSVLLLTRDPEDPDGAGGTQRVLAQVKSNVGQLAPSVQLRVEPVAVGGFETVHLVEVGQSELRAEDLLALDEPALRSKLREAKELLQRELEKGMRPVVDLQAAATALGISTSTLDRAKRQLGISSVKIDLERWGWRLPGVSDGQG